MITVPFRDVKPGTIFFAENKRFLKLEPLPCFPGRGQAVGANAYCFNQRKYDTWNFDQVEVDTSAS